MPGLHIADRAKSLIAATAILASVAATTLAGGSPAYATAADCEHGANGFIDIPDDEIGQIRREVQLPGDIQKTYVSLETGSFGGVEQGWARIYGWPHPEDQVWMDWTTDGGRSWLQCGPFVVGNAGLSKTSAAQRTDPSPNWLFRACGYSAGYQEHRCTDWW